MQTYLLPFDEELNNLLQKRTPVSESQRRVPTDKSICVGRYFIVYEEYTKPEQISIAIDPLKLCTDSLWTHHLTLRLTLNSSCYVDNYLLISLFTAMNVTSVKITRSPEFQFIVFTEAYKHMN